MEQFDDAMRRDLESFEVDDVIELFTFDASQIGGDVYRFVGTPVASGGGVQIAPSFGGNEYTVIPCESEGWEWSAGGTLPQPTIRFLLAREDGDQVSVVAFLMSLVETFDDLLGAQVHRMRTLRKFLDDGVEPNPQAHMGIETYTVVRKTNQTPDMIEFQLHAAMDLEDVVLPGRQVLNFCPLSYRRALQGGGFDYTKVNCPYVGTALFNENGDQVGAEADDACGRQLRDCKLRFGAHAVLPFGGFPGAGKFGTA